MILALGTCKVTFSELFVPGEAQSHLGMGMRLAWPGSLLGHPGGSCGVFICEAVISKCMLCENAVKMCFLLLV